MSSAPGQIGGSLLVVLEPEDWQEEVRRVSPATPCSSAQVKQGASDAPTVATRAVHLCEETG
jgi:hypothetical protein